jgi:hypothetical protein
MQVFPFHSTDYWTVSEGIANRTGFSCRECKKVINCGENIKVRDGRKMRLFYHTHCFSGGNDPREQPNSSYKMFKNVISDKAPEEKGRGKWAVSHYGYQPRVPFK